MCDYETEYTCTETEYSESSICKCPKCLGENLKPRYDNNSTEDFDWITYILDFLISITTFDFATIINYMSSILEQFKKYIKNNSSDLSKYNTHFKMLKQKLLDPTIDILNNSLSMNEYKLYGTQTPVLFYKDHFKVKLSSLYNCNINVPCDKCVRGDIKIYVKYITDCKIYTEFHKYRYISPIDGEPTLKMVDYDDIDENFMVKTYLDIKQDQDNNLYLSFKGCKKNYNKNDKICVRGVIKLETINF